MTPQEFFDKTVAAIRAQGRPSGHLVDIGSSRFTCEYRGPDGLKCAAGHHITDAEYEVQMEGRSVEGLFSMHLLPESHDLNQHLSLAEHLQNAHDYSAGEAVAAYGDFLDLFEERAKKVAEAHYLTYTPPVTQ
jgi:hypothetical protein